jgi:glucose-1-phosphate cytidylyltransferase
VSRFEEKPRGDGAWMNGGFFVCSAAIGDYISGDDTVWEQSPLQGLARDGQLASYRHEGFWQAMDTLRDRQQLERLWADGAAPWAAPPDLRRFKPRLVSVAAPGGGA